MDDYHSGIVRSVDISEPILTAVGVTLSGAIGVLWKVVSANYKDTKVKLDKCEEGHTETNTRLLEISREVGKLEGRQSGVEALSQSVLNQIHTSITDARNSGVTELGRDTGNNPGQPSCGFGMGAGNPFNPEDPPNFE